jgi:hypothetical protein
LFSHRSLRPHEIRKVPFVFAGDQFQTLNPTGFRWEAIKASYVEKISLGLDATQLENESPVSLNYQELTFNYRSTREIVGFSNLIKALRTRVFSLSGEIKPQQTWTDSTGNNVVLTNADRDDLWDSIKKYNVKVIVPCGEGEEESFIKADPILNRYVKFDTATGGTDITVLSAASAKGLEFSHVMTYGFGNQEEAKKVLKSLSQPPVEGDAGEASLPLQYFINKLYVSVSRPTRCLVVADQLGEKIGFWEFSEGENMRAIESGIKRWSDEWDRHVTKPFVQLSDFRFSEGQVADVVQDAEQLRAQAEANRSHFMMRQAANLFKNAGRMQHYRACVAAAFEFEDKHKEAADEYLASGSHYREACCAFVRAGLLENFAKILTAVAKDPQLRDDLEGRLAKLVDGIQQKSGQDLSSAAKNLMAIATIQRLPSQLLDEPTARSVRLALDRVLDHYLKLAQKEANWATFAKEYIAVRTKLPELTTADALTLARLSHRAGLWKEGAKYFEDAKSVTSKEYLECKARSASWPDNLDSLSRLGLNTDIVASFDKFGSSALSSTQIANIAGALASVERFEEAVQLALKPIAKHDTVSALLARMPEKLSESRQIGLLALYFSKLGQEQNLKQLLAALKDIKEFRPKTGSDSDITTDTLIKIIVRNQDLLLSFAVSAACMCGDAWAKIDWSPTSPFRKNRIIQELKRAYPFGRTTSPEKFLLCVGMIFEHLDAFNDAIEYFDKALNGLEGEDKRHASQRWVRCHLKRYHELKIKNNAIASNDALRKAEEGFYSAGIKRGEEDTLPQMPPALDANWLLQAHIDKVHQTIQSFPQKTSDSSNNPDVQMVSVGAIGSSSSSIVSAATGSSSLPGSLAGHSKVNIAGLELEYFAGKKLRILAPDGLNADYSFARGVLLSTDEGVVSADGLSMPGHGLVAKRISETSVQISFTTLGKSMSFGS